MDYIIQNNSKVRPLSYVPIKQDEEIVSETFLYSYRGGDNKTRYLYQVAIRDAAGNERMEKHGYKSTLSIPFPDSQYCGPFLCTKHSSTEGVQTCLDSLPAKWNGRCAWQR